MITANKTRLRTLLALEAMKTVLLRPLKESLSPDDEANLAIGQRYKVIMPEVGTEPVYTSDFNVAVGLAKEYGDKVEVVDLEHVAGGAPPASNPALAPGTDPATMGMDAVVPEILPPEGEPEHMSDSKFDEAAWASFTNVRALPSGAAPRLVHIGEELYIYSGDAMRPNQAVITRIFESGETQTVTQGDEAAVQSQLSKLKGETMKPKTLVKPAVKKETMDGTMADLQAGKRMVHAGSGDTIWMQDGQIMIQGGDIASGLGDEGQAYPLPAEMQGDLFSDEDPYGWQLEEGGMQEASGDFESALASPEAQARFAEIGFDDALSDYGDGQNALAATYFDAVLAGKTVIMAGGDVFYELLDGTNIARDGGEGADPKFNVPAGELAADCYISANDTGATIEEDDLNPTQPPAGPAGESKMKTKPIAEAIAKVLAGKTYGGKLLRLVKTEDEMELGLDQAGPDAEQFFVAVDSGRGTEIKVDGEQVFIGPFSSPEDAAAAVGAEDAAVVNQDGEPVSGEAGAPEGDDAEDIDLDDLVPLESKVKTPTLESIQKSVLADLRRESGDESLEIDTSITNATNVTDGAAGALSTKGVNDGKTNQTPQDAGASTAVQHDDKPTDMPGEPGATVAKPDSGALVTNDGDLSGAGDGKGTAKVEAVFEGTLNFKRGNFVKIYESASDAKVDSGNVLAVDKQAGTVTLEGGVTYSLGDHRVQLVR